jgi:hypothetical protein
MAVELNHTIVPAHDKEESARFYERMFGFEYAGPVGHFAPVRIPGQSLTLDFDTWEEAFPPQHYAFKVSEAEFDVIWSPLRQRALRRRRHADQPLERRPRGLLPRPQRPPARAPDPRPGLLSRPVEAESRATWDGRTRQVRLHPSGEPQSAGVPVQREGGQPIGALVEDCKKTPKETLWQKLKKHLQDPRAPAHSDAASRPRPMGTRGRRGVVCPHVAYNPTSVSRLRAYVILPLFAFSATGVDLGVDLSAPDSRLILAGVVLGLCVGKPVGVALASWLAIRTRIALAPADVTVRDFLGAACLCDVGYTMALLMADEAFPGGPDPVIAKTGVLIGSTLAAALGVLVLTTRLRGWRSLPRSDNQGS